MFKLSKSIGRMKIKVGNGNKEVDVLVLLWLYFFTFTFDAVLAGRFYYIHLQFSGLLLPEEKAVLLYTKDQGVS